jgi:uncharacterized MAPEG superfamily protein
MIPLKILVWLKILVFFIFYQIKVSIRPKPRQDCNMPRKAIAESAAKFDRIRRAHQSEVAEDYVEMIADLIAETGEARTVDLAAALWRDQPNGQCHHPKVTS